MANIYTFDGVPLDDPQGRWCLAEGTEVRTVPGRRSGEYQYPNRHGYRSNLSAPYEASTLSFTLAVGNGLSHTESMRVLEFLHKTFSPRHRLVDLVHHYSGSTPNRIAKVEVVDTLDGDNAFMRFHTIKVICKIPDVFWRESSSVREVINLSGVTSNSIRRVDAFSPSSGEIIDATLRFVGPSTRVKVTDVVSGYSLETKRDLADNQSILVNTDTWEAWLQSRSSSTDSWNTGTKLNWANNDIDLIPSQGVGQMFELTPEMDLSTLGSYSRLRILHEGTNNNSEFIINAARSYL